MLRLRVATFNTHGARPVVGPPSVANLCKFVRSLNADIVGLQEVHRLLPPPGVTQDQPARYRRLLSREVTFRRSFGFGRIGYGNALISPWEPTQVRRFLLPSKTEQRALLECEFEFSGLRFRVLNTHLGLDASERLVQSEVVAARLHAQQSPAILLGDLNATPESPEMRRLEEAGWRFCGDLSVPTFAAPTPSVKIDYVAVCEGWDCLGSTVVTTDVSDHFAVVADLQMAL